LNHHPGRILFVFVALLCFSLAPSQAQQLATKSGDFVINNFKFKNGETLPELKLHYTTLGQPVRDAQGRVTNAVMILHSTARAGSQFLVPTFAGVLFGPGQLLDTSRYYIILPDALGSGGSSKPSNGLHMRFPHYDYDDMVVAQYRLATEGLGVNHLRLLIGVSMGCMNSWAWGVTYPDFMDALMPFACLPAEVGGTNRMFRKMAMDAIRNDPQWNGGDYTTQPHAAIISMADLLLIMGGSVLQMQEKFPTREAADKHLEAYLDERVPTLDANDWLYQFDASRNYDPSPQLEKIKASVMFINTADDWINPPQLGIAEKEIKRVKNGRFVLLPISDQSTGHLSFMVASLWTQYLDELLKASAR
jgi:homoserine O-acetyltransferase